MNVLDDSMKDLTELIEAADILITNAELYGDPRMGNATDCYLVTLDDLESLRAVVARATGQTAGSSQGDASTPSTVSDPLDGDDASR